MLRGQFKVWIGSTVLAAAFLGWHTAVLALPHQVVPVPATTDALSLVLYVKSSEIRMRESERLKDFTNSTAVSNVLALWQLVDTQTIYRSHHDDKDHVLHKG